MTKKEGKDKLMSSVLADLPVYQHNVVNNKPENQWLIHQCPNFESIPEEVKDRAVNWHSNLCLMCGNKGYPSRFIFGENLERRKFNFALYICQKCDGDIRDMGALGEEEINKALSQFVDKIVLMDKKK